MNKNILNFILVYQSTDVKKVQKIITFLKEIINKTTIFFFFLNCISIFGKIRNEAYIILKQINWFEIPNNENARGIIICDCPFKKSNNETSY